MYRKVVHVLDVHNGKCKSPLHAIHSKQCCRKCISWDCGAADVQGLWKTNCVNNLLRYHNFDFLNASVWHAYITILGFTLSHSWMLVQENLSPELGLPCCCYYYCYYYHYYWYRYQQELLKYDTYTFIIAWVTNIKYSNFKCNADRIVDYRKMCVSMPFIFGMHSKQCNHLQFVFKFSLSSRCTSCLFPINLVCGLKSLFIWKNH